MSVKLTTLCIACLSLTACATVDLSEVATSNKASSAKVDNLNVVQRAAAKLHAAFSNRGFVAHTSRARVHSAANVLLKGLEAEALNEDVATGYVASLNDNAAILSDLRLAATHVEQTTKAAEVYLAIAPVDRSLRKELTSLERALLASREAEQLFEAGMEKTGGNVNALEFVSFKQSVNELRDVTDAFGHRVREERSTKELAAF